MIGGLCSDLTQADTILSWIFNRKHEWLGSPGRQPSAVSQEIQSPLRTSCIVTLLMAA